MPEVKIPFTKKSQFQLGSQKQLERGVLWTQLPELQQDHCDKLMPVLLLEEYDHAYKLCSMILKKILYRMYSHQKGQG